MAQKLNVINKKLCCSTMLKCSKVSREDWRFMETVERGTSKKYEHYVVPLAFRDLSLTLANNKK